jgi:predicted transcriptional regulator
MSLEATQKLQVIEVINQNQELTNKDISRLLKVSASQVSSIRYWLGLKGESYIAKIKETISREESIYKLYEDKFKNKNGVEKQQAREIMVDWIASSNYRRGSILTLPCSDWNIEKMVNENVSKVFKYVACERDTNTFIKMAQNSTKYGRNNELYHGEISEKLFSAKENQYKHIIADYCGTLNKVKKELMYACMNNIVEVNGTISVTLLKARDFGGAITKFNQFASELTGGACNNSDNEKAIKLFFKSLSCMTDFEVVQEFCYQDTSPMILIVLKRTK